MELNIKNKKPISHFLFIAMFVIIFAMLMQVVSDTDTFWHLKAGEYIVNNKIIPTKDIFSWYGIANNLDWYAHEWLSEVIFYIVYKFTGYTGIVFFVATVLTSLLYFMFKTNFEACQKNIFATYLVFITSGFSLCYFAQLRPHIFGFWFVAYTLYVLRKYKEHHTKLIWTLPLIAVLWVNMHGGSNTLLYLLILLTIITSSFNFKLSRMYIKKISNFQIKNLVIVFFLSLVGGLINQKGYKMLIYPFTNITDTKFLKNIQEWMPPYIKTNLGLYAFVLIGLVFVVYVLTIKEIDVFDFILSCMFAYLLIGSKRFLSLFVIVNLPIVLNYVKEIKISETVQSILEKNRKSFIFLFTIVSISCLLGRVVSILEKPINTTNFPNEQAIQIIKQENPKRLLNTYDWGGYLIYNNIKVFIDGRADIYTNNIYNDYLNLHNLTTQTEQIFEKYNFDMVIYPVKSPINKVFSEDSKYKEIYKDDTTIIYKKII